MWQVAIHIHIFRLYGKKHWAGPLFLLGNFENFEILNSCPSSKNRFSHISTYNNGKWGKYKNSSTRTSLSLWHDTERLNENKKFLSPSIVHSILKVLWGRAWIPGIDYLSAVIACYILLFDLHRYPILNLLIFLEQIDSLFMVKKNIGRLSYLEKVSTALWYLV